jgi:hypothetical protein
MSPRQLVLSAQLLHLLCHETCLAAAAAAAAVQPCDLAVRQAFGSPLHKRIWPLPIVQCKVGILRLGRCLHTLRLTGPLPKG